MRSRSSRSMTAGSHHAVSTGYWRPSSNQLLSALAGSSRCRRAWWRVRQSAMTPELMRLPRKRNDGRNVRQPYERHPERKLEDVCTARAELFHGPTLMPIRSGTLPFGWHAFIACWNRVEFGSTALEPQLLVQLSMGPTGTTDTVTRDRVVCRRQPCRPGRSVVIRSWSLGLRTC